MVERPGCVLLDMHTIEEAIRVRVVSWHVRTCVHIIIWLLSPRLFVCIYTYVRTYVAHLVYLQISVYSGYNNYYSAMCVVCNDHIRNNIIITNVCTALKKK